MSRRWFPLAAMLLAGALSAGCADDVAPAVRVGDRTVTTRELLDEVGEWASSPTLLSQLQIETVEGAGEGSYDTAFVGFLLSNRISFELHNEQFDDLGLELTDEELDAVRTGLFPDPAITEDVLGELDAEYAEQLVADVARQSAVSQAMGEDYQSWRTEALSRRDIEVNPRYGSWDPDTGVLEPPAGPQRAPADDLVGL